MSNLEANGLLQALAAAEERENEQVDKVYPKPVLKVLTEEQIAAIHEKGMLTPAEMLEEYNAMNYCPFTNGCSRCYEFENCNDCLIDHVNTRDEWMSFVDFAESLFGTQTVVEGEQVEEVNDKPKMLVRE